MQQWCALLKSVVGIRKVLVQFVSFRASGCRCFIPKRGGSKGQAYEFVRGRRFREQGDCLKEVIAQRNSGICEGRRFHGTPTLVTNAAVSNSELL